MNKNTTTVLLLLLLLNACGGKVYRPNLKPDEKRAYVQIDGSRSKSTVPIFGSKKTSMLGIHEYPEKCAYRWLGDITAKSSRSSKIMPMRAGKPLTFVFVREYETQTSGGMITQGSINISRKTYEASFVPKTEHTYVFEFDDKEKGFTNFKIYEETGKGRKELTQFIEHPNAGCEKVKELK